MNWFKVEVFNGWENISSQKDVVLFFDSLQNYPPGCLGQFGEGIWETMDRDLAEVSNAFGGWVSVEVWNMDCEMFFRKWYKDGEIKRSELGEINWH